MIVYLRQINVAESGSGNPGVITVSLNLFESPAGGTVECAYQLSIETGHQGTVGYFVEGDKNLIRKPTLLIKFSCL